MITPEQFPVLIRTNDPRFIPTMTSSTPFNKLNPSQAERLALLAEECGEVIQIIGKILRHGYKSTHPNDLGGDTNRALLENELGDVHAAEQLLTEASDVSLAAISAAFQRKKIRVQQYLHEQP
jgi:NTP pyrophosphatase (non-canonical NTP hydrolase)